MSPSLVTFLLLVFGDACSLETWLDRYPTHQRALPSANGVSSPSNFNYSTTSKKTVIASVARRRRFEPAMISRGWELPREQSLACYGVGGIYSFIYSSNSGLALSPRNAFPFKEWLGTRKKLIRPHTLIHPLSVKNIITHIKSILFSCN